MVEGAQFKKKFQSEARVSDGPESDRRDLGVSSPPSDDFFDARQALRNIRKFAPNEQHLSAEDRRSIVRKRAAEIRTELGRQHRIITEIIQGLRSAIEADPAISKENLKAFVLEKCGDNRLTPDQIRAFDNALDAFQNKHDVVEKYRKKFPNDADLFRACFGVYPTGRVEVIKRPTCFYFRCYEPRDYGRAYYVRRPSKFFYEPTDSEMKAAHETEGVALSGSKIPELAGTLTVENTSYLSRWTKKVEKKEPVLSEGSHSILLDSLRGDLFIKTGNGGSWIVKISERDGEHPSRLQVVDLENREEILLDIRKILMRGDFVLENPALPSSEENRVDRTSVVLEDSARKAICQIDITPETLKIEKIFSGKISMSYLVEKNEQIVDEVASRATMAHEEQHQINKLFKVVEFYGSLARVYAGAVDKGKTLEEACDWYVREAVARHRQISVDERARDEIIAFYSEATPLDKIPEKLLGSGSVYDFSSDSVIDNVYGSIISEFDKNSEGDLLLEEKFGGNARGEALRLLHKGLKDEIKKKFRSDYARDLNGWVGVIKDFEAADLGREEIVAYLMQEPVSGWRNMAERILRKNHQN